MTVAEALAAAERRLREAGVPAPEVDAAWLLAHATGRSRSRLGVERGLALPPDAVERFRVAVERRARREPLQLIVGTVGFRYLDLIVRPGVFVPRPETEVLVGEAIARTPAGGVVVEPCTGTGAVACAVAQEGPGAAVVATDLNPVAVALARENAARVGVAVDVRLGDLLAPLPAELRGAVDVLVSNPPYIAAAELADVEPEVRDWDPYEALVGGPRGNEVVERLVDEGRRWLRPGGWLLVELDPSRAAAAATYATAGGYADVGVVRDLAGRERILVARRPA